MKSAGGKAQRCNDIPVEDDADSRATRHDVERALAPSENRALQENRPKVV